MNKKRTFAICLALGVSIGSAFAVPAKRGAIPVNQPDGSIINVFKTGDEFMHFTTTEEGYLITEDADGFFRLATIDADGAILSTNLMPTRANIEAHGVKLRDLNLEDVAEKREAKMKTRRRAPQTGMGRNDSFYPTTGNPKGLIILVEYSDVKFTTKSGYDAKNYFEDMINGENFTQYNGTGSAMQYFRDQSGGIFVPDFDVLGPVTLPQTQAYYGGNDYSGNDKNPAQMVTHAIDILDPTVDFSVYDTDKDGFIDNVYVFYAGQGEADYGGKNTVWPHSWDVRYAGINKKVDGVTVANYACSNEWEQSKPAGVGTFVHEFSHVMGLPDLYCTNYVDNGEYTPGEFSVLDYGPYNNDGRTPPNYSAYEKNAMGWYEPIMLDGQMSVTLNDISSGEFGLIATSKNSEFFLLENRQHLGWDKYIPATGLLIWHIDYVASVFNSNTVNNNKNHQYVDIVEANEKPDNYRYSTGFTFPGTTGKTAFTSETSPALKDWRGNAIDMPITNIVEKNRIVSFDVAGGAPPFAAPNPFVNEYSLKNRYFLAEWEPVEEATEYFVTVYSDEGGEEGVIINAFDGKTVGNGWNATSDEWYDTNNNYGESSPSFKFSKNGATLTSPVTDSDITKIEFWIKGQSTLGTTLTVEGLKNEQWVAIKTVTPQSNKSSTETLESEIPSGVSQIRFVFNKQTGNIALDDVAIYYGGGDRVLPDYDNISTQALNYCKVDKLIDDINEYYFTVTASNGTHKAASSPVYIKLDGESGNVGIFMPSGTNLPTKYYNLQGLEIKNPKKGTVVIEVTGDKARKIVY